MKPPRARVNPNHANPCTASAGCTAPAGSTARPPGGPVSLSRAVALLAGCPSGLRSRGPAAVRAQFAVCGRIRIDPFRKIPFPIALMGPSSPRAFPSFPAPGSPPMSPLPWHHKRSLKEEVDSVLEDSGLAVNTVDLEDLRPGDIILTARRWTNLGTLLIRVGNFFKRGYRDRIWSHSAVYVGDGKIVEALPGGVVETDLREGYFHRDRDLRVLRHRRMGAEKGEQVAAYAREAVGHKYDGRQELYFVLNDLFAPSLRFALENRFFDRLFAFRDAYFCSELVANAFFRAGVYPFEREPRKIMPIDCLNPLQFDEVGARIHSRGEARSVRILRNGLTFALYVIAALFVYVLNALVALVLLVSAHLILVAVVAVAGFAGLLDAMVNWRERRREME